MKSNSKIFLLILLALAMVFSGCDGMLIPKVTDDTISNPDGSTTEQKITQKGKTCTIEETTTYPDGTKIVSLEIQVDKDDITESTIEQTTTYPDGRVSEKEATVTMKRGNDKVISAEIISYPDGHESGKKTETIESTIEENETKGHCEDITTTTLYTDGKKAIEKTKSEVKTGISDTSKVIYSAAGTKVSEEETKHREIDAALHETTADGIPLSSTEETIKINYDDQGNEISKVVKSYTNPSQDTYNKCVETTYTYVNGEPKETKCTEHLMFGCDSTTVTETNTDGTKTITIEIKDIPYQGSPQTIGTGSGTVDVNGKKTVSVSYTNGIENTTVTNGDTVTEEILTNNYYEKTITEKGVLTLKECEYLYDTGIVFKTVTEYSNGTETRKSGRFIKEGTRTPANYDDGRVTIPGLNGIYADTASMDIYADGHNEEPYTTFTTHAWKGIDGDVDTEFPYDPSVDMTNLHFPPAAE